MLSIIIPTNRPIKQAAPLLRSIYKQKTYELAVETILVVNRRQPVSVSEQDLLNKELPAVKVVEIDRYGANIARNFGAKKADGDYLLFLDDDCILPHKDFLYETHRQIKNSNASALGGGYFTMATMSVASFAYNIISSAWVRSVRKTQKRPKVLLGGNIAINRNDFLNCGGFHEDVHLVAEEVGLFQCLLKQGKGIMISQDMNLYHDFNGGFKALMNKAEVYSGKSSEGFNASLLNSVLATLQEWIKQIIKTPTLKSFLSLFYIAAFTVVLKSNAIKLSQLESIKLKK